MSSKTEARPSAVPSPRWSLAARLSLWYAASAFAVVVAATAFLYVALDHSLEHESNLYIADQVRILRALMRDHADDAGFRAAVDSEWGAARQSALAQVRVVLPGSNELVTETPGMANQLDARLFPMPPADGETVSRARMVKIGATPFRLASAWLVAERPGGSWRVVAQVAMDDSSRVDALGRYRLTTALVVIAALIACAVAGQAIARSGMRPLAEIAETASRIRSTTLDERIALANVPAELAELAATFNEMLDRLEEAFARLSRFSADIAHELRTPLNVLRGEIEVTLGRARRVEEYQEGLASLLEECVRLASLIDRLLFLARAESPTKMVERETLDVGTELESIREFYEPMASERGVTFEVTALGSSPVTVSADKTLLRRAVGNLVENALRYTPEGGRVSLGVTELEGGRVRIEVADTGPGISPEHLSRVFDRFYRVDSARTARTGGVGLGLAIVKSIATLHGGTIEATSEVGRGTRMALLLPRAAVS